jgi:hypothetical protein
MTKAYCTTGLEACHILVLRGKKQLKNNFHNKYWYSNASVECASLQCFVYKALLRIIINSRTVNMRVPAPVTCGVTTSNAWPIRNNAKWPGPGMKETETTGRTGEDSSAIFLSIHRTCSCGLRIIYAALAET